jgi:hypothetical protein
MGPTGLVLAPGHLGHPSRGPCVPGHRLDLFLNICLLWFFFRWGPYLFPGGPGPRSYLHLLGSWDCSQCHQSQPFSVEMGVSLTFCPGWPQTSVLRKAAGITGVPSTAGQYFSLSIQATMVNGPFVPIVSPHGVTRVSAFSELTALRV